MKATVRGETVTIITEGVTPGQQIKGVLGATVPEATTLVEYPDGESGYVKPDEVVKDAESD